MRARTLAIWGAVVLLLSIGLVFGGWALSLTDFLVVIFGQGECNLIKGCDNNEKGGTCYLNYKNTDLCRVGTCEGPKDNLTCVGKYAAETGGYVMMGAGAVGVVAAVGLAVMAVRKARA